MVNIKSKISVILIFCCCLFICISCVSASDADNLTDGGDVGIFDENYDFQNLGSTDVCSVENTSCLKSCSVEIGTFEELNNDLQKLRLGEVYNFEKDYCLKDNDFFHMNSKGPIICADNVIINGNGHVIDGANHSIALNVNADNVTVCNLTIINSVDGNNVTEGNFHYKYSPVVWNGDGGLILNCKFFNNTGLVGGVISWNGNDGLIDLCTFINNTATAVGGAIFLKGSNNVILNSIFFNSTSLLSGESIFFDHICKNDSVVNSYFNGNGTYAISGKDVQIDPEIFFYSSSRTYLADEYFDLVPLIYKSLINNGSAIYIDDCTSYYSEYNGTDFLFTLNRAYNLNTRVDEEFKTNCHREAVLSNTFHFKGISSFYDIYDNLFYSGGNCKREYNWVMDYLISGPDCYKVAMDLSKSAFDFFDSFKIDEKDLIVKTLSITLCPTVSETVKCNKVWDLKKLKCDVLSLNGNGIKIKSGGDSADEYHWVNVRENQMFVASNFTIEGFNSAVKNIGGYCVLNNMIFDKNKINYFIERDWGGAVLNSGTVICYNCTFKNNVANNGGAIFNQGLVSLNKVVFEDNNAFDKGDDVLNADEGIVLLDDVKINGTSGPVQYVKSISKLSITIITLVSYIGSGLIGFAAGFITANPVIGAIVGGVVGLALGGYATVVINSNQYDVNFNRLKMALTCIVGSVVSGVLAGIEGGIAGQPYKTAFFKSKPGVVRFRNGDIAWEMSTSPTIPIDNIIDRPTDYCGYELLSFTHE